MGLRDDVRSCEEGNSEHVSFMTRRRRRRDGLTGLGSGTDLSTLTCLSAGTVSAASLIGIFIWSLFPAVAVWLSVEDGYVVVKRKTKKETTYVKGLPPL